MEKEYKFGKMVQYTKDIGLQIKHVDMEDSSMQMVMYILENGKIINHMARVYIFTKMVQNMKVNGMKIFNTEMVILL